MTSVKQRLIEEFDRRAALAHTSPADSWTFKQSARRLRERGSGPLPYWAKLYAKAWKIK
jgi:hypothetical protein